jgi:hypothetical protein
MSIKAAILAANDRKLVQVPVPEWPEADAAGVFVRSLSGAEQEALDVQIYAAAKDFKDGTGTPFDPDIRQALVYVCDSTGSPAFGPEDLGAFAEKNAGVIARLAAAGRKLNGGAEKETEALAKN